MKKILLLFVCLRCFDWTSHAQLKIGVKAGLNFANVTSTAGFSNSDRTGYMIGGYIAPKAKKLLGFRSEIMLSRQGYNYKTNTNNNTVSLDYLLLPQLITLNIGKKINIHAGPQIAILLNAESDTIRNNGGLINYFKKFDYAVAGGLEISPLSGFFIGARINVSLQKANEEAPLGGSWPAEVPRLDVRNNVVQVYAGWRF
ncbi:MAG: outer membrane beta-barrel protein [Bacteroidetes bacterium]|nr:outer membrane beta-barrel protein [Bacteroidota bacterium]